MDITARINSGPAGHQATVATNGAVKSVAIPARDGLPGSGLNGGELLCLAQATCYGNDIYREAALRGIDVQLVEVTVDSEFGGVGEPARTIAFSVRVEARATEEMIIGLIRHTDTVAEIQNTIRRGMPVTLASYEALSVSD